MYVIYRRHMLCLLCVMSLMCQLTTNYRCTVCVFFRLCVGVGVGVGVFVCVCGSGVCNLETDEYCVRFLVIYRMSLFTTVGPFFTTVGPFSLHRWVFHFFELLAL